MKKLIQALIIVISALTADITAQVGINKSAPASTLDITAKNATGTTANVDGILIPRVNRQRAQSMTGVPVSTLIYVTGVVSGTQTGTTVNMDTVGYYYFDGSVWIKLKSGATPDINIYSSDGTLSGNRVVSQGANTLAFNGTAANAFSVDGSTFSVDAANDRVGVSTSSPATNLDISAVAATGTATTVEGLLIPRVNRQRAQSMTGVPVSTLIYVTGVVSGSQTGTAINMDSVGYYYFNGTVWVKLKSTDTTDVNIYNSDGTLTGNRTVSQGTNKLQFNSTTQNGVFTIDAANNRVGLNTAAPGGIVDIVADNAGAAAGNDFYFSGFGDSANPAIFLGSAGGTAAAPTGLANGAQVGSLYFNPRLSTGWPFTSTSLSSYYKGNGTTNLTDLRFSTSQVTRMIIDENGSMGVGTLTPAATVEITAKNPTGTTSNVDGILIPRVNRERAQSMTGVPVSTLIYVTGVVSGSQTGTTVNMDSVGYYYFNGTVWVKMKSTDTTDVNIYNSDGTLGGNRIVSQGTNTLAFNGNAVNAFSVDGSTFSVDAANGRVGLGSTAPVEKLDVRGAITFTGQSAANKTGFGGMDYATLTVPAQTRILSWGPDAASNGIISFWTGLGGASANEKMRIHSNGNVGIGTSVPTSLLSVNGTADKVGGGTWGTFSDSRMKKNVQPYTKGLPEVLKINTVTFQYNGKGGYPDDGKTYTGVIAQEIEKVLPGTVTKIKSDDFADQRKYDSSEITYTLINAIKEQQKLIEQQNIQIKQLQTDVQALKAKK